MKKIIIANWKNIHEDFNDYYQKKWEEENISYQETQEWIAAGFKVIDYYWVSQWKDHHFTPSEVNSWMNIGLGKNSAGFAAYLRGKGYEPNSDLDSKLKEITKLGINVKNLQGSLDLSDFVNLEELSCGNNKLTSLNVDKCLKLKIINCEDNQLTELKINHLSNLAELGCSNNQLAELSLANPNQIRWINCWDNNLQDLSFLSALSSEKLTGTLNIANNNFLKQDLSIFSRFTGLKYLYVGNDNEEKIKKGIYNRFFGSLEPLKDLTKLEDLYINNTDVDSGVEHLPDSLKDFNCSPKKRKDAKCQAIYNLFSNEQGIVETDSWEQIRNLPQKLQEYKQKIQGQSQQQTPQVLQPTN